MARILLAAGGVLLVIGVVLGGMQAVQHYQAGVERQQVDNYTSSILGPARAAGKLVSDQILPELAAYEAQRVPGARVSADAGKWHAAFARTRAEFGRAEHPGKLAGIASQFDKALMEYAASVAFFGKLSDPGAAPAALVAGEAAAAAADHDYAQAETLLACLRRSLGLPTVSEFRVFGACPSS